MRVKGGYESDSEASVAAKGQEREMMISVDERRYLSTRLFWYRIPRFLVRILAVVRTSSQP